MALPPQPAGGKPNTLSEASVAQLPAAADSKKQLRRYRTSQLAQGSTASGYRVLQMADQPVAQDKTAQAGGDALLQELDEMFGAVAGGPQGGAGEGGGGTENTE